MTIQDVFYTISSVFFLLATIVLVLIGIFSIKIYSKITKIVDSIESKVLTSQDYLRRFQLGALGVLLNIVKLFR